MIMTWITGLAAQTAMTLLHAAGLRFLATSTVAAASRCPALPGFQPDLLYIFAHTCAIYKRRQTNICHIVTIS